LTGLTGQVSQPLLRIKMMAIATTIAIYVQLALGATMRHQHKDLAILDFPTDRTPSNRPASRGAIETLLLPEDLTTALRSWSKSQNVTVFTVMLSAFAVLLSRASKLEDVLIGSPVANRRPETKKRRGTA